MEDYLAPNEVPDPRDRGDFDWSHGGEVSCFRDSRPWRVTAASRRPQRVPRQPALSGCPEVNKYRRDACLNDDRSGNSYSTLYASPIH